MKHESWIKLLAIDNKIKKLNKRGYIVTQDVVTSGGLSFKFCVSGHGNVVYTNTVDDFLKVST